jgi:hypothetical protein
MTNSSGEGGRGGRGGVAVRRGAVAHGLSVSLPQSGGFIASCEQMIYRPLSSGVRILLKVVVTEKYCQCGISTSLLTAAPLERGTIPAVAQKTGSYFKGVTYV